MTKNRIGALDGLRGIAVLLVIGGHSVGNYPGISAGTREWLVAFINPNAGVRVFFVLSGYLITSLLIKELDGSGRISLREFYRRRMLRIFPAFYCYLAALAVGALWLPTGINRDTLLAAGTFTWNYHWLWVTPPPEGTWNLGHLWTLALEQQFYLMWPVVLLVTGRSRSLRIALALVLWCPVARTATYFFFPAQRGYVGMMFHTAIDSIMVGCAMALLIRGETFRRRIDASLDWLVVAAATWLLAASPILSTVRHGFPIVAGFSFDAIAAACIVAWADIRADTPGLRWLARGPLHFIGLLSYSLYLWQQFFLNPEGAVHGGKLVWPWLGLFVVAAASYYCVERPALRRSRVSSPPVALTPATE